MTYENHVDEDESMTNEEFSDDERDHFNRYQNNDLSDVTSTSSIVYVNFGWMSRIEKKHIDARTPQTQHLRNSRLC